MDYKNWDMEIYHEYVEDIRIARNEIDKLKLMPPAESVICDIYALPSHNLPTYYALVYIENDYLWMVYAKPQIFPMDHPTPINMYRFRDAKKAEEHSAIDGRITLGLTKLDSTIKDMLLDIIDVLPMKHILGENLMIIDGVFQAIRVFENGNVVKEVAYRESNIIDFPDGKDYMKNILEKLHIKIGPIIGFEMSEDQKRIWEGE